MALTKETGSIVDLDKDTEKKAPINPKIDIVTATTLMALCVYLFFHALSLPRPDNTWRRAPGGMLLLLAISLFLMAASLLISALKLLKISQMKEKSDATKNKIASKPFLNSFNIRQLIAIIVTFVYAYILLGRIYFEFSSIIYLFVIIKIFWKEGTLLKSILISLIAPILFSIIFTVLFSQGLPGGSLFSDLLFLVSRRGA